MGARFLPAGDRGLVVEFGSAISLELNDQVRALAQALAGAAVPGLCEVVPTYRSLGIEYDPARIAYGELTGRIADLLGRLDAGALPPARRVEIPTCYGGEHGPDLADVAAHTGLSPEEVVRLHSQTEYPVFMIGFTAGFAYLGGLPERLHTPRLTSPRTRVPRGSVGIGGGQTGAYAAETPGGWRLIGRTPMPLFDPQADPPTPLLAGDRVRFVPIDEAAYRRMETEAERAASRAPRAAGQGSGGEGVPTLEVLQPGPLTTIQDTGRVGVQRFGISASGAVDPVALRVGNLLVGNPPAAAGLEFTGFGPTLRLLADAVVALTGGEFAARLDGRPVRWHESFLVRAGQRLEIQGAVCGFRGYLAVAGGIAAPLLLGSRATCLPARFGGHRGRRLEEGDHLAAGRGQGTPLIGASAPADWRRRREEPAVVRVVLGPQDDAFTAEGLETFLSATYRVTADADRMGCRVDGPAVAHRTGPDIISDWIPPGGIQVPGSGTPIILLADRQTTGGYAKIATVIGADLGIVAQRQPRDGLRFRAVSVDEAQAAAREQAQGLVRLGSRLLQAGPAEEYQGG